jgi:hypothetical protein
MSNRRTFMKQTAAIDTLDWHKTRPAEAQAVTLEGKINRLTMKHEAEVLTAWKDELAMPK